MEKNENLNFYEPTILKEGDIDHYFNIILLGTPFSEVGLEDGVLKIKRGYVYENTKYYVNNKVFDEK